MNPKNQLTRTPYLVLFMVLISIGVGTASAMITITLAGDVHVTGNTALDGELSVGIDNPSDDDFIRFDGGNENIQWDESQTRFRLSDSIVTGGHFAAGSISADDTVNRFGDGTPTAPESMTGFGDLYLADDLEVASDVYVGGKVNCTNCILGFYQVSIFININEGGFSMATPECDVGDIPISGGAIGHGASLIEEIGPSQDTPLAWQTSIQNKGFGSMGTNFYTICADYDPVHVS